jgi:hypothetical protein
MDNDCLNNNYTRNGNHNNKKNKKHYGNKYNSNNSKSNSNTNNSKSNSNNNSNNSKSNSNSNSTNNSTNNNTINKTSKNTKYRKSNSNISNEINVFDAIDRSTKRLYVDVLYSNISKFNLYVINQSTIENLCHYLKITDLKEKSNIIGTIVCITKMYHLNQNITEKDIIDQEVKDLFNKSLTMMRKLRITDDNNRLNVISNNDQHNLLFKRHLSLLLTYLNFRISVKRSRIDMRLLIIIYFSIGDLSLNMKLQKIKGKNQKTVSLPDNNNQFCQNKTYENIPNINKNEFIKVWKEAKGL